MKKFVVGFAFDNTLSNVVMIRKNRPEWQKGSLNGVGGHIEDGEIAIEAMAREFREETGVYTALSAWIPVLSLYFDYAVVEFFACKNDLVFNEAKTNTDEEVVKVNLDITDDLMVENLPAVIELSRQRLSDKMGCPPVRFNR